MGAIDEKIRLLEQKRELLEQFKRGVMQEIFSQKIRFKAKDGKSFPKWDKKKLVELGTFTSGVGFPIEEQGRSVGIPLFKVSDMNLIGNERNMTTSNNYVTIEQLSRLRWTPIKAKSIIFAKVGAALFLERKRLAENFLLDNNMMAFTPVAHVDPYYAAVAFNQLRLSKFAQVGALPSFNARDLATIKIPVPSQIEQRRISQLVAELNSSLDNALSELSLAKLLKQSMLQQLFA